MSSDNSPPQVPAGAIRGSGELGNPHDPRKLRIGIIGSGRIARVHAAAYSKIRSRVSVAGVVGDRKRIMGSEVDIWEAAQAFADIDDLLEHAEIDAVDVCLPHDLHLDAVLKACRAGKHVLLEKPIARTIAEVETMLEAVEETGVTLMVAHNHVFNPIVQKAREILDNDGIGRVHLAKAASYGWFSFSDNDFRKSREQTGGGVLIDTGIHFIYILQHLLGEIQSVTTVQGRLVREEMAGEDTVIVVFRFSGGAIGEITVTYGSRSPDWEKGFPSGWKQTVQMHGTGGALGIDLTENTLRLYSEKEMPNTLRPASGWTEIKISDAYATSFEAEIEHFVDCIRTGCKPRVGGQEGKRALEVVEAAYLSARESKTIYLDRRTT